MANPETAIAGLRDRYLKLVKLADKLPAHATIQLPEGLDLDDLVGVLPNNWPEDLDETPDNSESQETSNHGLANPEQSQTDTSKGINRVALALALFGWGTVGDLSAGLVGCKACFRRLGLWMYKPKENGDVTVYTTLDVATEHMEYCPWIDRLAQSGTGKTNERIDDLHAGWEIVLQAAKVKHRRRLRSTASMDTLNNRPGTPLDETFTEDLNDESKKTADREWWAKIRRMRQVLKSKSPRRKSELSQ